MDAQQPQQPAFWSLSADELLGRLGAAPQGLTAAQARERLAAAASRALKPRKRSSTPALLQSQFRSPLVLILLFAAALSFFLRDRPDAVIILAIVVASGLLGFWQERGAADAVERLLAMVQVKVRLLRDGREVEIPSDEVVPGDVVLVSAGAGIPGDCALLESKDLFVDEAALTGETYPVEKTVTSLPADTPLHQRVNVLFMGTHVVSGTAKAVVVGVGRDTEFGRVSERLRLKPTETEFERGVKRFGYLLMEVTLVLVIAIFAINVYFARPVLDSFLFSLALAVGLTPQLLPAIITINLAHGARSMAANKVIVKRLASIENLGSMDVLCSDKTGTLTGGEARVQAALDVEGKDSEKVLLYAAINACYETGFANPIDEAIRAYCKLDLSRYRKLDEVPYDFIRKRLTVLVSGETGNLMVTKGAVQNVVAVCSSAETADGKTIAMAAAREGIAERFEALSREGFRTLGVACRNVGSEATIAREHEAEMTFLGFLVLSDPPKAGVAETVQGLCDLGIALKMITGDSRLVADHVGKQVGLSGRPVFTGADLHAMSDEALLRRVNEADVFAEVEPNQKERIILALRKSGHVVGYLGDGINDASALHAADVGISVEGAVDVAKEAATIVLLEKDLGVLGQGVRDGRRTFANTLKYVFMATSANFGNMFSMAGASLFLSFLPLLPKQILLTNLMTDFPEMTIATDSVDAELVQKPRRWDIGFIRRFMLTFGSLSSVFDVLTFGVLLLVLHAPVRLFRTGWFVESVVSASLIVLVLRSRRPFFRSRPGRYLVIATLAVVAATLALPFSPLAGLFGFAPLPALLLVAIGVITAVYMLAAELAKHWFYNRARLL